MWLVHIRHSATERMPSAHGPGLESLTELGPGRPWLTYTTSAEDPTCAAFLMPSYRTWSQASLVPSNAMSHTGLSVVLCRHTFWFWSYWAMDAHGRAAACSPLTMQELKPHAGAWRRAGEAYDRVPRAAPPT